jgi:hypothetical protein
MIRRVESCQVAFAAGTRRVHGARRRTALGNPRSTGEPLTIQGCSEKANRPRNGRTQACAQVSGLHQG